MKHLSIRWRVALWNTAAFAVVLLGFGLLVYGLLRQTHYDQVDRVLSNRYGEMLADERLRADPADRFQFWVRKFGKHVEIFGLVVDGEGNVVAHAEQLSSFPPSAVTPIATDSPRFDSVMISNLGHLRRLTSRLESDQGDFTVVLLADLAHVDEELGLVAQSVMLTAAITLVVAAALAYFLAWKALAPVEQLRRLTNEITAENLDRRLPIPNPADELGQLAQTINSMIARLERSFAEIRRFTADASHELRTPIAVIRSEAEMGIDVSQNPEESRHRFHSILEECTRMTSATNQLLFLSKEDAGVPVATQSISDAGQLLQDAVAAMLPLAQAKSQRLSLNIESDCEICGDEERLRRVFDNLLENALKYTPEKGNIGVTLMRRGDVAIITFEDDGIGIGPEHLPLIFDRFYRVSKSTATTNDGAGLGLSIVKSIVTSLRGSIEVESTPGRGSVFRVHLPIVTSK